MILKIQYKRLNRGYFESLKVPANGDANDRICMYFSKQNFINCVVNLKMCSYSLNIIYDVQILQSRFHISIGYAITASAVKFLVEIQNVWIWPAGFFFLPIFFLLINFDLQMRDGGAWWGWFHARSVVVTWRRRRFYSARVYEWGGAD